MSDTIRSEAELLALFADNNTGDISPQDVRDFVVSAKVDESGVPTLTADRVVTTDSEGALSAATTNTTQLGYLDATSSIQTQLNGKQATITGAASSIVSSNVTASRALISDGSGKVSSSSVTATTLGYLDATSSVQTQLNGKQATITGAASSGVSSNFSAYRVVVTDASGKIGASSIGSGQLDMLGGIDTNQSIQTAIDALEDGLTWHHNYIEEVGTSVDEEVPTIHVTWTNDNDPGGTGGYPSAVYNGIEIWVKIDGGGETLIDTLESTASSYDHEELADGTYQYRIRPCWGPFRGPWSNWSEVETLSTPTDQIFTVSYTANFGQWDVGGGNNVNFNAESSTVQSTIDSAYGTTSSVESSVDGDTYTYTVTLPEGVEFNPYYVPMSRGELNPLGMAENAGEVVTPTYGYNDIGGDPGDPDPESEGWGWDWGFDLAGANVGWVYLDDTLNPGNGLEGCVITSDDWWANDDNSTLQTIVQSHGRPDAYVDGTAPYRRIYTDTPGSAPTEPAISGSLYNVTPVADWSVA